jgi:hypothetical protein
MKIKGTNLLIGTTIMLSPGFASAACPNSSFAVNVSEFDSTTALSEPTLYPVGGSGISNGNFSRCNHPGVQVGLRITARSAGQITPTGFSYVAPKGDDGNGDALWNIEPHFDSGHMYGSGTFPNILGDVTATVQIDCDPAVGIVNGPLVPIAFMHGTPLPGSSALLVQGSQNLGFTGMCGVGSVPVFDPTIDGSYEFSISVTDNTSGEVIAEANATAVVGNPPLPPSQVKAVGIIESSAGGYKFPDGTVQSTAAPTTGYITRVSNTSPGPATAMCSPGDAIISGGGGCVFAPMTSSCPSTAAGACSETQFEAWTVECDTGGAAEAFAICFDNPVP